VIDIYQIITKKKPNKLGSQKVMMMMMMSIALTNDDSTAYVLTIVQIAIREEPKQIFTPRRLPRQQQEQRY